MKKSLGQRGRTGACDACGYDIFDADQMICEACRYKVDLRRRLRLDLERSELRCKHYLDSLGIVYQNGRYEVLAHPFASDKERFGAWMVESLFFSLQSLMRSRKVDALRGWGQAREYMGRCGGYGPRPEFSDMLVQVQNELEDTLKSE